MVMWSIWLLILQSGETQMSLCMVFMLEDGATYHEPIL